MSTVAQMVANVQSYAPSLSLTRATIVGHLNNALQDLFEEANLEATTGQGTDPAMVTVAGQQWYALPGNCVKARALQWRLNGVLEPVTYVDLDQYRLLSRTGTTGTDPTGGALYFTIWGNRIGLWPIPTANGTAGGDGELVLDFYKVPATLVNDTDVPDIPAQYHNLLEFYATAQVFLTAEEGQFYQAWMAKFDYGKRQMQAERIISERVLPARVRPARW